MKNWSQFRAGTDEAILPLPDIMALVSTPRHSARLSGNYVSSVPDFGPPFLKRLKEITGNAPFWDPVPR
ncbi:MAG: hypothetical protein WAW37_04570 [Syntrophobacteraceae bacterium]